MTVDPMQVDSVETEEPEEEDISVLEDLWSKASDAETSAKIPILKELIASKYESSSALALQERSIYALVRAHFALKQFDEVIALVTAPDERWSKARHAKMVKQILGISSDMAPLEAQESLSKRVEEWTVSENRTFLRHRVQTQLAGIYFAQSRFSESLNLVNDLTTELKQLDDKSLLVEIHLLEAQLHWQLANLPKAKAALTAARTAAHAIYIAPGLQAKLDLTSGTIHVQEGDFTTAHSYFLEAFEQWEQLKSDQAEQALVYMNLCLILHGLQERLQGNVRGNALDSKKYVKYADRPALIALDAIGKAAAKSDLQDFDKVWQDHREVLEADSLVSRNLQLLQDQLLESNLLKVLEPYSAVELSHVATCMHLPVELVERKLSQMILDGTFKGILHQGAGHVICYEDASKHTSLGLEIIENVDEVVTSLFARSQALRTMMI